MAPEGPKKPKKEEVEDEEEDDAYTHSNKKKNNKPDNAAAAKPPKRVKKEEQDEEEDEAYSLKKKKPAPAKMLAKPPKKEEHPQSDDLKTPISNNIPVTQTKKHDKMVKKEVKKKRKKNGDGEGTPQKRERKVYDLPGQKRDPPEERDPLRIFYETLYHQVPGSEMASIWMMESGLLPAEAAKKVYERKLKKSRLSRISSPVKAVASRERSVKSVTVRKKASQSSTKSPIEKKTGSTI